MFRVDKEIRKFCRKNMCSSSAGMQSGVRKYRGGESAATTHAHNEQSLQQLRLSFQVNIYITKVSPNSILNVLGVCAFFHGIA